MIYSTRHKSLKQKPSVLNFLRISYIHSSHLCSQSNVPLSSPNVEPRVFWSTETTAIPNHHWGGQNRTSVSRFVTSIVFASVGRGPVTKRMKGTIAASSVKDAMSILVFTVLVVKPD